MNDNQMNEIISGKEYYESFVPWVKTDPVIPAGKTYLDTYLEMKRLDRFTIKP